MGEPKRLRRPVRRGFHPAGARPPVPVPQAFHRRRAHANGNLTSKTDKITLATTSYTYDTQDKLTRIDFPDLSFATYRYDGLGRRIEKDVNGAVTQYVYDGSAILLEYDGAGSLLARYSHGQRVDQPLAVERGGQSYYYQADHLGSLRKITDAVGAIVNSYDYDSYGNIEAIFEGIVNPYTYTGREFDAESGLYFYRARYYDPATGRFLAEDPIGFGAGDANLYRYAVNNPVNFLDPSGRICLTPIEIAALSGAAGGAVTGFVAGGPVGALVGAGTGAAVGAIGEALAASGPVAGTALGAAGAALESKILKAGKGGIVGGAAGGAVGGPVGGALGGVIGGAIDAKGSVLNKAGQALKAGKGGLLGGAISLGLEQLLKDINDCPEECS